LFDIGQPGQFVHAQGQGAGGQRGPHQPQVLRHRYRTQPVHQILGLIAVENRVLVEQTDRSHAAPVKLMTHGRRLFTSTHQHRDVGWP